MELSALGLLVYDSEDERNNVSRLYASSSQTKNKLLTGDNFFKIHSCNLKLYLNHKTLTKLKRKEVLATCRFGTTTFQAL